VDIKTGLGLFGSGAEERVVCGEKCLGRGLPDFDLGSVRLERQVCATSRPERTLYIY